MFYSVYDYLSRKYTYYEAPGLTPAAGTFRSPGVIPTPEALAVKLPSGARKVGEGVNPKGVVASSSAAALSAYTLGEGDQKYLWAGGALFVGYCIGFLRRRK